MLLPIRNGLLDSSWFHAQPSWEPWWQSLGSLLILHEKSRHCSLLLAGDIPPRSISQTSISGRLTHYLYFWDNLFLRSISGYQLLPNVGSNTCLTMAQWLNYNGIWSVEGRLKNFATDREDPFIFGGWQDIGDFLTKWRERTAHNIKHTVQWQVDFQQAATVERWWFISNGYSSVSADKK